MLTLLVDISRHVDLRPIGNNLLTRKFGTTLSLEFRLVVDGEKLLHHQLFNLIYFVLKLRSLKEKD